MMIFVILTYFSWLFAPLLIAGFAFLFWSSRGTEDAPGYAYTIYLAILWTLYRASSFLLQHTLFPF